MFPRISLSKFCVNMVIVAFVTGLQWEMFNIYLAEYGDVGWGALTEKDGDVGDNTPN